MNRREFQAIAVSSSIGVLIGARGLCREMALVPSATDYRCNIVKCSLGAGHTGWCRDGDEMWAYRETEEERFVFHGNVATQEKYGWVVDKTGRYPIRYIGLHKSPAWHAWTNHKEIT